MMKVLSLNVGRPQEKEWEGKIFSTSIFKFPVTDRRRVMYTNIAGDEQADLRVHGGISKAVYSYDVSHYHHWKKILKREDWSYGMFGENLTTEGLPDDSVRIGSIYKIGNAKLQVIQPRFPCMKINIRFGLHDMIEKFIEQKRSGIYWSVIEEGDVQVNDEVNLIELSPYEVTIQDFTDCFYSKGENKEMLHKILAVPYLTESKRNAFQSFATPFLPS